MKDFLENALGKSGSIALAKSAELAGIDCSVVFARTILAWVDLKGRFTYDQTLPGTDVSLKLSKSESGFNGQIGTIEFKNDTLEHVGAYVAVALKQEPFVIEHNKFLAPWSQNVDTLVKAHFLRSTLKKNIPKEDEPKISDISPLVNQPEPIPKKEPVLAKPQPFVLKPIHFTKKCFNCGEYLFHNRKWVGCVCLGSADVAKVVEQDGAETLVSNDLVKDWAAIKAVLAG